MKWHDVLQNTESWQALRCGKATASNFGTFMANYGKAFGEPAKKYAVQVALERVTGCKAENGYSNEHMERGHLLEPVARALYEQTYFVDVTNGGFFDCGYYGDSPDGLVANDGVIEIKSVTPAVHYNTLSRGKHDPAYTWQLVGHLDCTGRDWVDFVSFCPDFPEDKQLIVYRVGRDQMRQEIEMLRERREEFNEMVCEIHNRIIET
jgi:hypothetical protein